MQKGFSSIFLVIGLFVIVLIGGATYLARTNSSNKQSILTSSPQQATQTPSSDKTADWKTYTNEKYGFSIKYPSIWTACDQIVKPGESSSKLLYRLFIDSQTQCQAYEGQAGLIDVSIFIYDKSDDYAKPYLNPTADLQSLKTTFAGVEAYKSQDGQKFELLRGNYFYSINATRDYNSKPENVKTIDTILSTLKFN